MAEEWLTERLLARPPRPGDREGYRALFRDPAIEEWLRPAPLPPFSDEDIAAMLHSDEIHWETNDFGPWALIDRRDGSLVGRGGLRWLELRGRLIVELPWTIASHRQGEGLASEAAAAAIEWAGAIELLELAALIRPDNAASLRVAEKVGLRADGEVLHSGLPHLVYSSP
jgi:[ribosomal protein S5]-alanine N-acetyltransferase